MGIVQKEALRTSIVSYFGLVLGYVNKGALFVILLSVEQIGLINLVVSVGMLMAQLANLGVVNTTWKFFPFLKNEKNNHYGFLTLSFLILFSGILLFTLITVLFKVPISQLYLSKSAEFVEYYYWILPIGISFAVFRMLDSYLRGLYKNVFSVIANDLIHRLVITTLLGLYASGFFDFKVLLISISLSQIIPTLLLIVYMMKIGEWHFSVKEMTVPKRLRKIIISYSLFSYVNSLGTYAVAVIDTLMVASLLGLGPTGVYTLMLYLIRALLVPYGAILRVAAPLVAEHWKTMDMKEMNILYKKVSSVNLVIGLFFFLGVWVNRVELFGFLPDEYASGMYVFLFLMSGRLIDAYLGLNGTILVTSKKYKYDMIFMITLFVLVIVLNTLFIPIWGVYGAALSTAIAYFSYNVSRTLFVYIKFRLHPFEKSQWIVFLLFSAIFTLFHFVPMEFGNVWLNLIVKSSLVFVLFPLVIYLFKIENETVGYADKVLGVIKSKLKK